MKKILIVDDERQVLDNICQLFKGLQMYEIITAQDGNSALDILSKNKIDLLIVDYILGAPFQGDELIKIIRIQFSDKYENLPIILMTGTEGTKQLDVSIATLGTTESYRKRQSWQGLLEKAIKILQPESGRMTFFEVAEDDPVYDYEDCGWFNCPPPALKSVSKDEIRNFKPELLIVVATKIELCQVLRVMEALPRRKQLLQFADGMETYYIGNFGAFPACVVKCEMASQSPMSSGYTSDSAIKLWQTKVLIMIGIAFGKNKEKYKPGDVIVAKQIILYENQRVGKDETIYRGSMPDTGFLLQNRFSNVLGWEFKRPDDEAVAVHEGAILSGEKLVDDPSFKEKLFNEHPTAIAGEMEGAGIYAAAARNKIDWILVKGISDWGDGKKHHKYQDLAAAAATSLALHVFSDKNVLSGVK